ncbi:DNA replication licensing factor MCM8 [Camponotus floridanus]|uniref:DNA replication licensing factor MCM8 n=1 Tax=Camponotus floridanus TaxID=104421 RepID=E2ARB7_CAMFO|nr:DNA replication licensing factor MCM8 [Camponotus floridanus]
MVFGCSKCHLQKLIKQSQEIYTLPKKCDTCGTSKFYPVLDSPFVKSILFQIIRIQEPLNDEQIENKGKVPKVLDVELMDNLVNICMPGDDITLTGIIKVQGVDDATKIQVGTPFSLYMKAITVINNKRKCQNKSSMNNEISLKNYLAIQNIYKEPNIFALLVHSLCPSIYGHEMIKAGLILSLFGGNIKRAQLRDGIHILLIGDPGLGKSQMLQACARISTKGVYICGNSSTSSGLTVTLTKETGSNDFALEPGALVLADQGCCCIDEFDKICSQHQALLESMEQQSVTVAKSGIISSFPARTSILAAANPIGGQYDKSKTITENLNINQPILSRFDLIFLLLDKPDKHFDNLLCKHIMTVHTNSHTNFNQEAIDSSVNDCSLRKKLMLPLSTEIIPQPILRSYISYARQYVKPKLSAKAAAVLQSYYLELRLKNKQFGNIPIFNRQLEAMIRLTEARAKLELRIEATESDALDVIDILRYTMIDTSEDCITSNLNSDGKLTNKKGCVKLCKSFNFRSSIRYKCECIKRNGLQDRCMMWDCMGRPECMTKLYPVCKPGRAALLKLTDLGDAEIALRKFYCADQAREAALATYCKLTCDKARQEQILSCDNEDFYQSLKPCARSDSLNDNDNNSWCKPFCDTSSSYQVCVPSVYPNYVFKPCDICCPSRKLEESYFSYNSPLLMCSSS